MGIESTATLSPENCSRHWATSYERNRFLNLEFISCIHVDVNSDALSCAYEQPAAWPNYELI